MKRSEMLKEIKTIINIHTNKYENGWVTYGVMVDGMAKEILDHVEEKGMVPPLDEEKSYYMKPNGEMIYEVREWEEE